MTSAKLLSEARAGRVQADIFDGIDNMLPLEEAGLLETLHRAERGSLSGATESQELKLLDRGNHVCVHAGHQHDVVAEGRGAEDIHSQTCSTRN